MAFRVYDTEKREWVYDKIYMNPNGELFKIKQSLFGMSKIPLDASRYVYHESARLWDKNGVEVHEGDYIKANVGWLEGEEHNENEERIEIGLVTYATELSSYIILCVDSDTFYTLGSSVSSEIEIIGNVFDGYATIDGEIRYE